jgi:hypothetical protein
MRLISGSLRSRDRSRRQAVGGLIQRDFASKGIARSRHRQEQSRVERDERARLLISEALALLMGKNDGD